MIKYLITTIILFIVVGIFHVQHMIPFDGKDNRPQKHHELYFKYDNVGSITIRLRSNLSKKFYIYLFDKIKMSVIRVCKSKDDINAQIRSLLKTEMVKELDSVDEHILELLRNEFDVTSVVFTRDKINNP